MDGLKAQDSSVLAKQPLENAVSAKRQTLQDLKPLLEDRGGRRTSNANNRSNGFKRKVFDKDRAEDRLAGDLDSSNFRLTNVDNKDYFPKSVIVSDVKCNNLVKMCSELRFRKGRWCFSRFKSILFVLLLMGAFMDVAMVRVEARSSEPRYETAYACEGKTLKIGCGEGSVIHLIRANYGRFSITICNDHGNTDWSVNCMSTRSLRVLHSRCSMHQNCSILASTTMFGDPCPNTLKYLEAHYQCIPASTTSTTNRPSPPWLITSPPTVWQSTVAPPVKGPVQTQQGERKKPTVITPPTFRPHITLPPEVRLGDIGTKKTTTRQPEPSSSERDQAVKDYPPKTKDQDLGTKTPEHDNARPRNDKPSREDEGVTQETPPWPPKDDDSEATAPVHVAGKEKPSFDNDVQDDFDRRFSTGATVAPPLGGGGRSYCAPVYVRGLHWNWTLAGSYGVQPCPGGATGLAKWKCEVSGGGERSRHRGSGALQSGENYLDLGLVEAPGDRHAHLMRRLGSDALLKGRDGDNPDRVIDYRGNSGLLPDAQASSVNPSVNDYANGDSAPSWHGATPDLSECRSVWLNSLEARVREGESLLSISNDLAQVTSSKTLYGGDMTTTTVIMKKLAQRMAQNVQTFSDLRQREAIVTDMLLGVIKTGSNLLEESQRASWADLNPDTQNRIASALLTQLEENAFLLADAVSKEKTILQIVKNICLSVRVLEVKTVEDETFPSMIAQEQWKASEDTITIPKAALLDNRQNDLVRIVFFAFDRLEEILPPVLGARPQFAAYSSEDPSSVALNSERDKRNVTRVLNSKVISASLGNGRHIQLSQSVKLTMKHLKTENVTNPICVFWDYTQHGWSQEGCQVEWSNTSHTGCACSHLTNFAILMDVHGTTLGARHEMALRLVTLVGCGVSAVALAAAIIVFHCFRNMKSDRVLIHKNLCACLLIAELIFMCGIDQTDNRVFCGIIAGLLHYFFLAAFAWMFLEGFHLYVMLVEVFEPERARARWYCCAAYCAPAVVVLASAAAYPHGYGTRRHCWLTTDHLFVMSFVGPVALVLTANWICLSMVIYMMCHHSTVSIKAKENSKLYKIRVWLFSSLVLAFLLGLTWTSGLLYLNEQTVFVAYTFTTLNSLQGLFIFIFHCLQNEIFQKECGRLCRRHPWLSRWSRGAGGGTTGGGGNAGGGVGAGGGGGSGGGGGAPATASSCGTASASNKHRYHQSDAAADAEDVADARDTVTSYNIHPEMSRWNVRPTAPIYVSGACEGPRRAATPQPIPHSASMHSQYSYNRTNLDPTDYQNANARSRSPSLFSNKMAANASDWALLANPIGAGSINTWKNTSSKHYAGGMSTLPHQYGHGHAHGHEHEYEHEHELERGHSRTYSPYEMGYRKHHHKEDRRRYHHHQHQHHTYSPRHRRESEHDDPVYEEIERNETLASDVSDDNSGPDSCRPGAGLHHGDHRPLIACYPPHPPHYPPHYPPHHARALAAVLSGESVVCHLEPHSAYDARALSQPSF